MRLPPTTNHKRPFLFSAPPQMAFFNCGGVRLLVGALPLAKGVAFSGEPHVVHRTASYELWLAEFKDPDGNQLALMAETAIE
jgi:hypothetical protein